MNSAAEKYSARKMDEPMEFSLYVSLSIEMSIDNMVEKAGPTSANSHAIPRLRSYTEILVLSFSIGRMDSGMAGYV